MHVFKPTQYAKDEFIVKEGKPCDKIYILMKGEVQISKSVTFEDKRWNKITKNVALLNVTDGALLGEHLIAGKGFETPSFYSA